MAEARSATYSSSITKARSINRGLTGNNRHNHCLQLYVSLQCCRSDVLARIKVIRRLTKQTDQNLRNESKTFIPQHQDHWVL